MVEWLIRITAPLGRLDARDGCRGRNAPVRFVAKRWRGDRRAGGHSSSLEPHQLAVADAVDLVTDRVDLAAAVELDPAVAQDMQWFLPASSSSPWSRSYTPVAKSGATGCRERGQPARSLRRAAVQARR
jgi:hypothetical protein